jgi:hypothetical protein
MTLDLDMATEFAVQDELVEFMESRGFETLHRSTGYSNHRHSDAARGRVDFMYVQGKTCEQLFGGVRELPGPSGIAIAVPRPEHLIAMKVQAMKDAPERTWQDLADIGYLLRLPAVDATRRTAISRAPDSRRSGMSSRTRSEAAALNLTADVPTTAQDVAVLRQLRAATPSWFSLTLSELDALLPRAALYRRPPIRAEAHPFVLS